MSVTLWRKQICIVLLLVITASMVISTIGELISHDTVHFSSLHEKADSSLIYNDDHTHATESDSHSHHEASNHLHDNWNMKTTVSFSIILLAFLGLVLFAEGIPLKRKFKIERPPKS
ncbi:MAG: hypothetical protein VX185_13325 [Pseudomonadota bacterium]|nr:hypothetical protein [Pseudomonadota bacterium]